MECDWEVSEAASMYGIEREGKSSSSEDRQG
jgi:hypothetical protein